MSLAEYDWSLNLYQMVDSDYECIVLASSPSTPANVVSEKGMFLGYYITSLNREESLRWATPLGSSLGKLVRGMRDIQHQAPGNLERSLREETRTYAKGVPLSLESRLHQPPKPLIFGICSD